MKLGPNRLEIQCWGDVAMAEARRAEQGVQVQVQFIRYHG
jgi:hypothetical protein